MIVDINRRLDSLGPYFDLAGRLLIAKIFLLTGIEKALDFEGTQGFMESKGIPGSLLILVVILELVGAAAIIFGWRTRITAFLLAGFTLIAALIFHTNFSDHMQYLSFLKNMGIAGGFLFLVVNGAGSISLDAITRQNN